MNRVDRVVLALYPQAWRARYGAELTDLIADLRADGASPWRIRVDLTRAAGAERLRAAELLGEAPGASRARGGSLLVLWAWVLFVVAGCALQKGAEHWSATAPGSHRVPTAAFAVLVGGALCAAVLVAAGLALAVPALMRGLRAGLWPQVRRRVGVAAGLTVAAGVGTVGLVTWARHLTDRQRNGHDLAYTSTFVALAVVGVAGLTAWTAVATAAARRIDLPERVLRLQARLSIAVTAALVSMTAATLTWAIALNRTPVAPLTAMAAAVALAAAGARRTGITFG